MRLSAHPLDLKDCEGDSGQGALNTHGLCEVCPVHHSLWAASGLKGALEHLPSMPYNLVNLLIMLH